MLSEERRKELEKKCWSGHSVAVTAYGLDYDDCTELFTEINNLKKQNARLQRIADAARALNDAAEASPNKSYDFLPEELGEELVNALKDVGG